MNIRGCFLGLACLAWCGAAWTQAPPGYVFERGYPAAATSQRARDDGDLQRAVTAYRFWYTPVSNDGILNGNRSLGIADAKAWGMAAAGPRQVGFTLNSDTPYGSAVVDVSKGPVVIELPPGAYIGLVNDHNQSWVLDMGLPGPDAGKGGKHLVLPPGFKGSVPAGYHAAETKTLKNLLAIRALPVGGDVPKALDALRAVKIYPLSTAASPVPLQVVDTSTKAMDSSCLAWEDNIRFWEVLHKILEEE